MKKIDKTSVTLSDAAYHEWCANALPGEWVLLNSTNGVGCYAVRTDGHGAEFSDKTLAMLRSAKNEGLIGPVETTRKRLHHVSSFDARKPRGSGVFVAQSADGFTAIAFETTGHRMRVPTENIRRCEDAIRGWRFHRRSPIFDAFSRDLRVEFRGAA